MVKGFFDQLGCQQTRVYDVGVTEWGRPAIRWSTRNATRARPRRWRFTGCTTPCRSPSRTPGRIRRSKRKLVEQPPFKKVLIGRGATNSKGPEMVQWNALMSIKTVLGKLPVNLIFIAEGDEERMDIGLRKFVRDHPDLVKGATPCSCSASQAPSGARRHDGRFGRLRVHRADHQRQELGPRPGRVRYSRHQQALGRQPRVASHQDARVAGLRRWQHAADSRVSTTTSSR